MFPHAAGYQHGHVNAVLYARLSKAPFTPVLFLLACRLQWSTAAESSVGDGSASLLMELIVPSNQGGGLASGVALVIEVSLLEDGPFVRCKKKARWCYISSLPAAASGGWVGRFSSS